MKKIVIVSFLAIVFFAGIKSIPNFSDIARKSIASISGSNETLIGEFNLNSENIENLVVVEKAMEEDSLYNPDLKILINEVMVGIDGNGSYEFIELYNPNDSDILLTDWSIKKISSTGKETSLVASARFENKIIQGYGHFLMANDKYDGKTKVDINWPKSYSLAYSNNSIVLYSPIETIIDKVSWIEIPKGSSFERISPESSEFIIKTTPTPTNSGPK